MSKTILDTILRDKAIEIQNKKLERNLTTLKASLDQRTTEIRDFNHALGKSGRLNIMAEIKKASPSNGLIRKDFNHLEIAQIYQKSGLVSAISVLTDEKYFKGQLSFIADIKNITTIPIFRKDFIIDEYQVYETYLAEADALLLIAAALTKKQLKTLIALSHFLGMECLVETHSEKEVDIALQSGARIIGINARDLQTFTVDKILFAHLAPRIPKDIVKVAESGLETKEELKTIFQQGAQAALIGTSFMKAKDINEKLKEVLRYE